MGKCLLSGASKIILLVFLVFSSGSCGSLPFFEVKSRDKLYVTATVDGEKFEANTFGLVGGTEKLHLVDHYGDIDLVAKFIGKPNMPVTSFEIHIREYEIREGTAYDIKKNTEYLPERNEWQSVSPIDIYYDSDAGGSHENVSGTARLITLKHGEKYEGEFSFDVANNGRIIKVRDGKFLISK